MQEREQRRRIREIYAWTQVTLGSLILAATGVTAVNPEEIKERTKDVPVSMGALLQFTNEAGIPTAVTLGFLAGFSGLATVRGIRNIRKQREGR